MRWSFHLVRVAGIEVRIHATFLLLLAFYAYSFYAQGGTAAAVQAVVLISLIFFCVLLHEFGHAFAARMFGIHTPDITLLPIGGVARLERMPEKPSEEIIVAIAGPLVNVAICALLLPFVLAHELHPKMIESAVGNILPQLFIANVMLVGFNLIPAFPMDGGRVLRALLAMRMDYARATGVAASIGQSIAVVGGTYFLFHEPRMLALIALFIFIAAQSEASHAQLRSACTGLRVRDAMVTRFEALPRHATLHHAVEALLHTSQHDFPVLDEHGNMCGVLTRDDLVVALRNTGPDTPVAEVMRTGVPSVPSAMLFDRACAIMQEKDAPVLPVIDTAGRVIGLFTPENVGELLTIRSALAAAPKKAEFARV
jgi:Zn-dependent protease/CBS domain-containing protein